MASAAKLLDRMRNNPRDWRIEDLKVVATYYGIEHRQHGTSHVIFRHMSGAALSVPAARPIKSIYIRRFVALVDAGEESK